MQMMNHSCCHIPDAKGVTLEFPADLGAVEAISQGGNGHVFPSVRFVAPSILAPSANNISMALLGRASAPENTCGTRHSLVPSLHYRVVVDPRLKFSVE